MREQHCCLQSKLRVFDALRKKENSLYFARIRRSHFFDSPHAMFYSTELSRTGKTPLARLWQASRDMKMNKKVIEDFDIPSRRPPPCETHGCTEFERVGHRGF